MKRRLEHAKKAIQMSLLLISNISLIFCKITNLYLYFQIITDYKSSQLPLVFEALERMHAHLTAAVVSNDPLFLQVRFYSSTVSTTTIISAFLVAHFGLENINEVLWCFHISIKYSENMLLVC